MYFDLLKSLADLDRCHCGPEMEIAYEKFIEYYQGARLITHGSDEEVYGWQRPPYWECRRAELKDEFGNMIASRENNRLAVFSYSPPTNKIISHVELERHLFSDPNRPDLTCFHFRNQYRHWEPEWGFSIPHNVRMKLRTDISYQVDIESSFNHDNSMIQAEYHHIGQKAETFMFVGHFDHPAQVNDGLAGCLAAFEIVDRLKEKNTRFSYRALASVEIVGSVYYLNQLGNKARDIRECLFLGFSGIASPLVYQQSFRHNSIIDKTVTHLLRFENDNKTTVYNHRELIGNDENVYDSVGYEIPCGTLMRWPFQEYHTELDNLSITNVEKIEEVIGFTLRVIDVIENNYYVKANYIGLPSLACPKVDLYLSPNNVSGTDVSKTHNLGIYAERMHDDEYIYLCNNTHLLNQFMQNILRLSDGMHTILDIAEISAIPFSFALCYATKLRDKGLVTFVEPIS